MTKFGTAVVLVLLVLVLDVGKLAKGRRVCLMMLLVVFVVTN